MDILDINELALIEAFNGRLHDKKNDNKSDVRCGRFGDRVYGKGFSKRRRCDCEGLYARCIGAILPRKASAGIWHFTKCISKNTAHHPKSDGSNMEGPLGKMEE